MTDNFKYLSPRDFNKLGPEAKRHYLQALYQRHLRTDYLSQLPEMPSKPKRKATGRAS